MKKVELSAGVQIVEEYAEVARSMFFVDRDKTLNFIRKVANLNGFEYNEYTDKLVSLDWEIYDDISNISIPWLDLAYLPAKWFSDIGDHQHRTINIPAEERDWDPVFGEGDGLCILHIDCLFFQDDGQKFEDALLGATKGNVSIPQRKEV